MKNFRLLKGFIQGFSRMFFSFFFLFYVEISIARSIEVKGGN